MRDRYDFLVVGAGSAGSALARRLSDATDASIGLLEAGGPDDDPQIHSPSTYFRLWGSNIDWDYQSVPQPGTRGRVHRLPRGRVLGGTSAINGMVYLRGARADFDGWAAAGCAGWSWDDVNGVEVRRLVITADGRVSGVEARTETDGRRVFEAGQVIVCAGAYETPRLLMLSGLGRPDTLQRAGVKPLIDLPVGENLQDHLLVSVVYSSCRPISPAHAHITEACAFARSSLKTTGCDIEISFNKEMHFAPEQDDEVPRYTIIPGITHLRSRGTVKLPDRDAPGRIVVDHGYFTEPEDMQMMIEAVRLSRRIGETSAFAEWCDGECFPGPEVDADDQIAEYARTYVSTWFHPAGSCRMGTGNDAVVDPQLSSSPMA